MIPTPFGLIRPHPTQPLRLVATGALSSSSRTAFFGVLSQRQRRGSGGNRLYRPRRIRGTVPGRRPRNGGLGAANWSRKATWKLPPVIFGSFHHWKEHSGGTIPSKKREPSFDDSLFFKCYPHNRALLWKDAGPRTLQKRNTVSHKVLLSTFLSRKVDQNSALPQVLGCSSTSRMLFTPVRYITIRSKPRP